MTKKQDVAEVATTAIIAPEERYYRLIRNGMLASIETIIVKGDRVVARSHDTETLIGSCSSRMCMQAEEDLAGVKWKV
jgi:hypothetical protein